jgi:proteic killer suppression protein
MARVRLQPVSSFTRKEQACQNNLDALCFTLSIKHAREQEKTRSLIVSFKDRGTEDIFDGEDSKAARKTLPSNLHKRAGQTLDQLSAAVSLNSLSLPGLRLEKLKGDRAGQNSIRINDQYRVCFRWTERGAESVEIVDYH